MKPKNSGFTLVELMIVVVLIGVVAALGIPSFKDMIEYNRIKASTNELLGVLNFARTEAVRRGEFVAVQAVGGGLQNGVEVVLDKDPTQVLRRGEPVPEGITLSLSSGEMPVFRGNGLKAYDSTNAIVPSHFKLCSSGVAPGALIVVNPGGQTSRAAAVPACP